MNQAAIRHDEGQAQPRHEGQRKRVNVDNIILRIEGFDRRQLFARVDQLGGCVFLDDRNPPAIGDFNYFFASFQRKNGSRRIVEAGVDIDQLRLVLRHQPLERVHSASLSASRSPAVSVRFTRTPASSIAR